MLRDSAGPVDGLAPEVRGVPTCGRRHHWEPNTFVIWDNRSTQHYAIQDYFPAVRRMMRATVIGDRPR